MKLNKQILEAVRRGIQLALDDYEDIETSNSISHNNDIIDSDDVIQDEIDFWDQWIDLGLPSGTLWAKSNIGADCDNYAESWYGDYFAWGEIEPKEKYDWETYKFAWNGSSHNLTKYVSNENYLHYTSELDDLTELQSEDDVATILFGNHSHIPTKKQMQELLVCAKKEEKTNYNGIEGLNGILFTGKNGKSIFMPKAGSISSTVPDNNQGSDLRYWTSTLSNGTPSNAYCLDWESGLNSVILYNSRCYGFSIRPVYNR